MKIDFSFEDIHDLLSLLGAGQVLMQEQAAKDSTPAVFRISLENMVETSKRISANILEQANATQQISKGD